MAGQVGFDAAALEALYEELERPLYNVVYRWLWDREEARDVVQEAFVRLWRRRDEIEIATVRALVYRIALNLAASRRKWRRLRRWVGFGERGDADPDGHAQRLESRADDQLLAGELQQRLQAAIEALPERLRRVVALCELAEMSYADAAAVLGIPPGTVASRRNAAVKHLRAALAAADSVGSAEVKA